MNKASIVLKFLQQGGEIELCGKVVKLGKSTLGGTLLVTKNNEVFSIPLTVFIDKCEEFTPEYVRVLEHMMDTTLFEANYGTQNR